MFQHGQPSPISNSACLQCLYSILYALLVFEAYHNTPSIMHKDIFNKGRYHPRRRTRSAAARTAAHAKIRTVPLISFQSPLETKIASVSCGPHNTLAIRFTYCLYRSIPFFSSINFPSKISCNTCLHGIRCNLLTSDASITRKVVW